ncbi:phage tail protein [Sphingobacterium faecium]|uniref:phage tail protein n=1 Tax=Sphingobacterium faecium TaxID=34087 RepID=UPI002478D150|nr:phage tail protein [Sphingobacterium faecium]WGQ12988.1 phage tail protein [Sphingobacterium faecium]
MAAFTEEKQGVHELVFTVDVPSVLDIEIGDIITFHNEVMKVNYTPTYTNNGEFSRSYVITFEGHRATLYDQPLVDEGDIEFNYYGDAVDLLNLVLTNINTLDAGWTAGEVETVEPQAFEFDNVSCLEALNTIAEKFGLEWKIKQRVITLKKNTGVERAVVLSQGRSNGLYSLTREYLKDSNIVTRAYALGSTKNLPAEYEGKRLSLPDYIEANTDKYGIKVKYYKFDDVYPRRTGTASAVTKVNDKTFTLTDTGLNFDVNGQRAGENDVKIVFKSGSLNGQEFTVSRYDHATKTITYKANEDSNGLLVPFGVTVAEVGDKYTLVGLIMPQTHIDEAKAELVTKRAEALTRDSVPKVVYSLNSDVLFLKDNGLTLEAGDIVRVKDLEIGLDELLTIQRVSYPAIFPQQLVPGMQFVAEVGNTSYEKIQDKIYKDVQEQKTINGQIRRNTAELARVNALRLRELQNYIFDADDYFDTDRIKPQSIETQMLSVGAKSQNFYLSGVTMQPNYLGDASRFYVSAGQLQHREISIDAGYIWNLSAQAFYGLEPNKTYYLSAKCSKTNLTGTYSLTDTPQTVESQAGFYHFNIGVLYPIGADGNRFFANTSGVSYVVGSQITTGRVKSLDGNTWFDLDTGEIRGKIKFTSGQTVESAIDQAKGEAVAQSGVATQQAIAALSVGSRNLLLKSDTDLIKNGGRGYFIGAYDFSDAFRPLEIGKEYTLVVKAKHEGQGAIGIWVDGHQAIDGMGGYAWQNEETIKVFRFVVVNTASTRTQIHFYNVPEGNYPDLCIIYWAVLYEGNITNPPLDWTPSPEDFQQQIIDTDNARKEYIDAQDNLKEVEVKAYTDGKVSAEEARAIADATAKANAAKSYADAQDLLLKAQTDAYADGKVTAEEQARISQAQTNLQAAKDYAEAQDNLSKIETKAYADGIVDAEEARAIADAQTKLNEAKLYAEEKQVEANGYALNLVNNISVGGRNYFKKSSLINLWGGTTDLIRSDSGFSVVGVYANNAEIRISNVIDSNGVYTVSFEHKYEFAPSYVLNIDVCDQQGYNFKSDDLDWKKFSFTFTVTNYGDGSIYNFVDIIGLTAQRHYFRNFKVEKGNKATDWTPAPEDLQQQIIDTDNARKAYIDTQDNLKETQTRAYADGIVSAEEARAIADATAKANVAKSYADAQDLLLKAQTDAYTDGKVSVEEQARINQAQSNLDAAKAYAEAQDNLSKIETKAYADGIVDAEEQRAIADAQAKLNEAKLHADSQASQAQANAIAASNQNTTNAIAALSVGSRNYFLDSKGVFPYLGTLDMKPLSPDANFKTGDVITVSAFGKNGARMYLYHNFGNGWNFPTMHFDNTSWEKKTVTITIPEFDGAGLPMDGTRPYGLAINASFLGTSELAEIKDIKVERGSKATDWTPAPEDLEKQIVDTDNARKLYIDAQDNLKETEVKAYADGKVGAEEARAIADATAKANSAKAYADAQDLLLKAQTDAYADGKVSVEESARIAQAQANLTAAQNYATAQDNLAKIETKAYADGIVDAEEARAIADAQTKLNEAKNHADAQASQAQANAINVAQSNIQQEIGALSVGARNLILKSDVPSVKNGGSNYIFGFYNVSPKNSPLKVGQTYTLVVKAKHEGQGGIGIWIDGYQSIDGMGGYAWQNEEAVKVFRFVVEDTPASRTQIHFYNVPGGSYPDFCRVEWLVMYEGNITKPSLDWTPAPEDIQQQIIDADNAQKAYIDAQDNLKEIQVKAYADGVVDAEEARAIADAQAKLNEAKSHAEAQASQAQVNAISLSNQNITNAIKALSIGGRNYYRQSLPHSLSGGATGLAFNSDGANTMFLVGSPNGNGHLRINNVINSSGSWVVSGYFRSAQNYLNPLQVDICDSNSTLFYAEPNNKWTYFEVAYNVPPSLYGDGSVYNFVDFENLGHLYYYFKNIKVEKGSKATDWTPAPEDLQQMAVDMDNAQKSYIDSQDALKEVQTKAYADGIVSAEEARAIADATAKANAAKSYADNLKVQTDNYVNSITTPIKNKVDDWTYADTLEIDGTKLKAGTVTADKIDTLNLVARHIATSNNADKLTINTNNDNSIKIRHSNGQVGIQMGLVGGVPKLVFYNEFGNKVWEGGMSGIVYVDNVPESWSTVNFKLLPGNHSNVVPDVNGNITSSEKAQLKSWVNMGSGFLTTDFGGAPVISSGTTFYSYSAGINAQAENNRVYEGLHTSQLKSTGNWMPNGWYGQSGTALFQVSDYPVQVYATTLEYYANGKMIASILIDDITML